MVLKQRRDTTDVLIIDASKGFAKKGKNNVLRACDIKKIADVVRSRVTVDKFSKVVSRDEIRANDYNLNIPRYVDSSEKPKAGTFMRRCSAVFRKANCANYNPIGRLFPS